VKTIEVLEKVLKGKRIKADTVRHYRDALGSLARYSEDWAIGGVVINEWLGSLKGYSDTTVRNWFNYVNSAGKYIKKAYGLDNPCENANRPKVAKKRRRYFTAYELAKIIRACRFEQDKLLILTLLDSTCRIGELVGLKAKNVGETWIDVEGKSGERRYRCDEVICNELRRLGEGGKPVFRGRDGRAANVVSLKHRVRRVIKEAGITGSKLGPHTLRHSGASLVAQETGSALAVKALLQHDKIDTSMEYIHDAEDIIQQRISPLRLVGEKMFGAIPEMKQLAMGDGNGFELVEGEEDEVSDFIDGQFRGINEDMVVRSQFKADDLRLLRRAFIGYIRSGVAGSDESRCRDLFRRMLRREGK